MDVFMRASFKNIQRLHQSPEFCCKINSTCKKAEHSKVLLDGLTNSRSVMESFKEKSFLHPHSKKIPF